MTVEIDNVRQIAEAVKREMGLPAELQFAIARATPEQAKAAQQATAFEAEARSLYAAGTVVEPPYPLADLALRPMFSSVLPQCVDARANHIVGWGHRFESRFDAKAMRRDDPAFIEDIAEPERKALRREVDALGGTDGFGALMDRVQRDVDTVGHAGVEYIRDGQGKALVDLHHVPGRTLLLGVVDDEQVRINRPRLSADGMKWEDHYRWERTRPVVQIDTYGTTRKVWFRTPGDPRARSRNTGRLLKLRDGTQVLHDPNNPEHARELLIFRGPYNANSPYALPPWAGVISSIAKAELIESIGIAFLESGGVAPFIITLYGASISAESTKRFQEQVENRSGPEARFKALILNAVPDGRLGGGNMDASSTMTPKIGVTPLGAQLDNEAFYDEPNDNARSRVRSACGLAPIHIGDSSDYNRATSQSAMEWAEDNTFGPARRRLEQAFERFIAPELGAVHWALKLRSPDTTNPEDIERIIRVGIAANVGTSNDYAPVIERALGVDISTAQELWGNLPPQIALAMLQSGALQLDSDGDGDVEVAGDGQVVRFMRSVSPAQRVKLQAGLSRLRDALLDAG